MPGRNSYTSDEVESCRDACDALLAAWAANDIEDTTLEGWSSGRRSSCCTPGSPTATATSRAPTATRSTRCGSSPTRSWATTASLRVEGPAGWVPSRTVLRLAVGDDIELTANRFERLAAAYLAAIEATYPESAG